MRFFLSLCCPVQEEAWFWEGNSSMKPYQYWHKWINVPAATEALSGIRIHVTEIGKFLDKTVYKKFQVATVPDPI
jgi:hypothetical protein